MSGGPGLTSDLNFQHSCEVYQKGARHRTTVYGLTRDEVVARLALTFKDGGDDSWMDEFVVTETKSVRMGFPAGWMRVARGLPDYY